LEEKRVLDLTNFDFMKYLLIIFTTVFLSCNKEEQFSPLKDFYSLTSISCECSLIQIVDHQQQCRLDTNENILVVKTFGDVSSGLFLSDGAYPISISNDIININSRAYRFQNDGMFMLLDSGSTTGIEDLPVYHFVKN
jgi:hypothetical protein